MSEIWHNSLSDCLRLGVAKDELLDDIDDILDWFSEARLQAQPQNRFYAKLSEQYGDADFRRRFEEFLDRLMVSDSVSSLRLFPSNISEDLAKRRYRKILSVFHPDKGANHSDWLNYRVEQVNRAFQKHKNNLGMSDTISGIVDRDEPIVSPLRSRATNSRVRFRKPNNNSDWRLRFGSPEGVQRKIVLALVLSGSVIIFMTVMSVLVSN